MKKRQKQVQIRPVEFVYIAVKPCGCVTGATVDLGDTDTAKSVANFIKSGRHVERVSIDSGRNMIKRCQCESKQESLL